MEILVLISSQYLCAATFTNRSKWSFGKIRSDYVFLMFSLCLNGKTRFSRQNFVYFSFGLSRLFNEPDEIFFAPKIHRVVCACFKYFHCCSVFNSIIFFSLTKLKAFNQTKSLVIGSFGVTCSSTSTFTQKQSVNN